MDVGQFKGGENDLNLKPVTMATENLGTKTLVTRLLRTTRC